MNTLLPTYPADDTAIDLTVVPATETNHAPRPVEAVERIQTVDLVRGMALLGILMMNIPLFGYLESGMAAVVKDPGSRDYFAFAAVGTAFEGTMRALFSMLFGAGMVLFATNKPESIDGPSVAEYYYRRLVLLVLFGMLDAYILHWRGDILFMYGLMGMLLYPFRKLKANWLLGVAFACLLIGLYKNEGWQSNMREARAGYLQAVKLEKSGKKPSEKQLEQKANWERIEGRTKPDPKADAKALKEMRGNYASVFRHILPENAGSEVWYVYHGAWDMLVMMFLGMALLQLGFFSNKLSSNTYKTIVLIGYGIGLPISWFYVQHTAQMYLNPGLAVDTYRISPNALYDLRRGLLALGHASLLMLVYRSQLVPWLMRALTAVGQMAFTNYLTHSIVCALFFNGYGLGYYGKLAYYQLYYVVFTVWVFQLIISPIWLRYFRFGPFEWLWRSLTYWTPQPMRRAVKQEMAVA
ncbi:DUF418 domain-containing protein [Fibrella forsythiae]|uniref:DUF418 domain-containing protein n=1 Tax=Fibrella forsythiae TaxID=2817061 RepID=UPI001E367C23|nr:DUF418 domain-containing protein [Fibrella forsythiae]